MRLAALLLLLLSPTACGGGAATAPRETSSPPAPDGAGAPIAAREELEAACDGGHAASCTRLARTSSRRDAARLLARGCAAGDLLACELKRLHEPWCGNAYSAP